MQRYPQHPHLLKQVPHAGGTHAHEELHELRGGAAEEGHAGLAGHGLGQQGLTGTCSGSRQGAEGSVGRKCQDMRCCIPKCNCAP